MKLYKILIIIFLLFNPKIIRAYPVSYFLYDKICIIGDNHSNCNLPENDLEDYKKLLKDFTAKVGAYPDVDILVEDSALVFLSEYANGKEIAHDFKDVDCRPLRAYSAFFMLASYYLYCFDLKDKSEFYKGFIKDMNSIDPTLGSDPTVEKNLNSFLDKYYAENEYRDSTISAACADIEYLIEEAKSYCATLEAGSYEKELLDYLIKKEEDAFYEYLKQYLRKINKLPEDYFLKSVIDELKRSDFKKTRETLYDIFWEVECRVADIGFLIQMFKCLKNKHYVILFCGNAHTKNIHCYLEFYLKDKFKDVCYKHDEESTEPLDKVLLKNLLDTTYENFKPFEKEKLDNKNKNNLPKKPIKQPVKTKFKDDLQSMIYNIYSSPRYLCVNIDSIIEKLESLSVEDLKVKLKIKNKYDSFFYFIATYDCGLLHNIDYLIDFQILNIIKILKTLINKGLTLEKRFIDDSDIQEIADFLQIEFDNQNIRPSFLNNILNKI